MDNPECAKCEDVLSAYSRGRADAELEFQEFLARIDKILRDKKEDCLRHHKEYNNTEISNRIVKASIRAQGVAYDDALRIIEWFAELPPKETTVKITSP